MNIDYTLWQAYLATTFVAVSPEGEIRIRVGKANPSLGELLSRHNVSSWAFLTAFNPGSRVLLNQEENELRQARLEGDLRVRGYVLFPGVGKSDVSDWPPERSVLVLRISQMEAVRFGKNYKQNAIVVGTATGVPKLLWTKCSP